ncbi:hypothetical protein SAMN05518672_1011522 [Chitinophaga sp. CF118]|nr:hypothetical protein SAMN05518672_1011522 [Chitinophaga sp. CF118]
MKPGISIREKLSSKMKKALLFFTAALLSTQLLFAGTKELEASSKLKTALIKEFAGASAVKWYSDDNKTFMARFTLREHSVTAYFDGEGNLLATRRYIQEDQLPMTVANKLAKRYPNEQIRWVVEFQADGNTIYYVTLEDAANWKVIRATSTGTLSVHQTMKKA